MAGLRTFDAFPKTEEQYKKKSQKGGVSTILTYLFLIFIAYSEFGSYFGGYVDQQYIVDPNVKENVQINLDMIIKMPCQWIDVHARDLSMDTKLASSELKFEDMPFFIPYDTRINDMKEIITPELDEILGDAIPAEFREKMDTRMYYDENNPETAGHLPEMDGCHVFGSVSVNRLMGDLQITAKGYGYRNFNRTPKDKINFAHVINELSFGDFYPYIDNPLDSSAKFDKEDPMAAFVYHTYVVPTIYQKMGAEVDTNQYSVAEYRYHKDDNTMSDVGLVPGIFIKYNFESMTVLVSDKRLGFLQFIIRLVAILSFVVYIASWLFVLVDTGLIALLGPKWSLRYQPDVPSHGILEK